MPIELDASPSPRAHIKTLMKIGYDFSTALSDIIDNSISAESSSIHIHSQPGLNSPFISITDNGYGMEEIELINNMKIGCKDPSEKRELSDLGRFGSGMKTASFSQARKLTVLTKKTNTTIFGASWDIDRILEKDSWCLEKLEDEDIRKLENDGIIKLETQGTQVIWQNLTCYQQNGNLHNTDTQIASLLQSADNHIGLHFHRFMHGNKKVSFFINDKLIDPIDPFMTSISGYQEGRGEKFRCKGGYIEIKTHVLPSLSRIGKSGTDALGGAAEISHKQGLYIYRNKRLINAGGWLNLNKFHQLNSLARIQIDIPSSLDDEWSTDVKKASLQLPGRVKKDLRKYLSDPITRSRKAHKTRGQKNEANKFWKICKDDDNDQITYEIHTENKDLIELIYKLPHGLRKKFSGYLLKISHELPLDHIFNTMADRPFDVTQTQITEIDFDSIIASYMESRADNG